MRFVNWEAKALLFSSLLILGLGFLILLTGKSNVIYEQEIGKTDESVSQSGDQLMYLFCLPFRGEFDLFENRTEINLDDLSDDLLNYFTSEKFRKLVKAKLDKHVTYSHDDLAKDEPELLSDVLLGIMEELNMNSYYIMNEKICFISLESSDFRHKVVSLSKIFSNETLFVYKKETHDLYQMSTPGEMFDQAVMLNRGQTHTNCKNNSNNRCLNECFKSKFRLSKYFYDGNETGFIQLDWQNQDGLIEENEKFCFQNCSENNCKSTYIIPTFSSHPKIITYTTLPLILSFDYWLELIALILPVTTILIFQFSAKLINRNMFKIILLFTCLISGLVVSFALYRVNYLEDGHSCEDRPETLSKKEISFRLLEAEPFSLIICVGIGNIILADYDLFSRENKSYSRDFREQFKRFYKNKTFSELELETDKGFEETVESIYLRFLDQNIEIDWNLSPRVLFLQDFTFILSRCFQIDVNLQQPAYQSMLATSKLAIKFKHSEYLMDLLPNDTRPNYKNLEFKSTLKPTRYQRFEKHLKDEICLDYQQTNAHCGNQQSCLESCLGKELISSLGKIAEKSIIDKEYYDVVEWNTIQIQGIIEQKKIPKGIKRLCKSQYNETDCHWTAFKKGEPKKGLQNIERTEEINVYYDLVKEFEEAQPSARIPLSDLLYVQSVFIALNLLRLAIVVGLLKFNVPKVNLLHSLIYGFCLIALFMHLIYNFEALINEEPTLSQHYESPSLMHMNDAVFCFKPENPDFEKVGNSTGNYSNDDRHDKANLRIIISEEEEEETEAENEVGNENEAYVTAALEISQIAVHKSKVSSNDFDENSLYLNETRNASTNYIENELAADGYVDDESDNNSYNQTTENQSKLIDNADVIDLFGVRLQELSINLTPEVIFDKILYLDKSSGEWITLDSTNNYTNHELHIDSFFYQGNKCFSLNTQFDYSKQQFTFLQKQNTDVLKILFSRSFKQEQNLTLSIATKEHLKMNFDNFFDGLYLETKIHDEQFISKAYSISQRELVQITYEDYFYWLNPLVYLIRRSPDLNQHFMQLLETFKVKHRSASLNLPLQEKDLNLRINETLFKQFYERYVQENGPLIDQKHPQIQFSVNEMEINHKHPVSDAKHPDYDVKFSLSFLKKVVKQSKAVAYLKFIIYLLNALLVLIIVVLFDLLIHRVS